MNKVTRAKVRYTGRASALRRGSFYTVSIEEIRTQRFLRSDEYQIFVRRIGGNNQVTFYYNDVHDFLTDFDVLKVLSQTEGESMIPPVIG